MSLSLIISIIVISIIVLCIRFVWINNAITDAMEVLPYSTLESIELNYSIDRLTRAIQSRFSNNIQSGKTIMFEYEGVNFIVAPISRNKSIIALAMSEDKFKI